MKWIRWAHEDILEWQLYPSDDEADQARDAVLDVYQNKTSGHAMEEWISRMRDTGEDFEAVKTTA